jgi:hypothetical protein
MNAASLDRRLGRLETAVDQLTAEREATAIAAMKSGRANASDLRRIYERPGEADAVGDLIAELGERLDLSALPKPDSEHFAELQPETWAAIIASQPMQSPYAVRARVCLTAAATHEPTERHPTPARKRWIVAYLFGLCLGLASPVHDPEQPGASRQKPARSGHERHDAADATFLNHPNPFHSPDHPAQAGCSRRPMGDENRPT